MTPNLSRRELFHIAPAVGVSTGVLLAMAPATSAADTPAEKKPALWPGFPRQDAKWVAEMVAMAHSNEARVKELAKAHPNLVNAWWDWGFGDWESPLGAASHVGNRGIAEFLLVNGARIDIFAAAMLGFTDVVKAFVTAQPGIQRNLGPHGIPLLTHAKMGGKKAADTLAYLESLGDAGQGPKTTALTAEQKTKYLGKFASAETDVKMECKLNKAGNVVLELVVGQAAPASKMMNYGGNDEFFPSGVPTTRFKFTLENNKATMVTLQETDVVLVAKRVG